jgi:hypothetical protein
MITLFQLGIILLFAFICGCTGQIFGMILDREILHAENKLSVILSVVGAIVGLVMMFYNFISKGGSI